MNLNNLRLLGRSDVDDERGAFLDRCAKDFLWKGKVYSFQRERVCRKRRKKNPPTFMGVNNKTLNTMGTVKKGECKEIRCESERERVCVCVCVCVCLLKVEAN